MGKRDDKALGCRPEGEANSRATTRVNAGAASSTPPTSKPTQLELFPGRACPSEPKPAMSRTRTAKRGPRRRDGVQGGGTRRKCIEITGETLPGLLEANELPGSRETNKGRTRNGGTEARQGVGGGHSTEEPCDKHGEGRTAASIVRTEKGKTAGLPPRGKALSRQKPSGEKKPVRLNNVRKLQRALYRAAKRQPDRKFTLLYDKIYRPDIVQEAWQRVKANKGAAGVDEVSIADVVEYGE